MSLSSESSRPPRAPAATNLIDKGVGVGRRHSPTLWPATTTSDGKELHGLGSMSADKEAQYKEETGDGPPSW